MDKLEAMRTFVAIVDEGSLTRAARVLRKAQPTVVRSLGLLEDTLGVRLLQRTTRRMSLTAEGQTYLERCRQILADVDEAEAMLCQDSSELRGKIRLTAPVLFGQLRVAPAIRRFLEQHPAVQIEVVLLDRVVNLVEEGFDLGVRIANLEDSSLVAMRLGEVVRTCVASPALLARVGVPKHPGDLRRLPTVTFSHGALGRWKFVDQGRTLRLKLDSVLATNQAATGIQACIEGLCFGQFLSYQVQDWIAQGRLVPILREFEPAPTSVQIVFAHGRLLSARKRALLDWLKRALGDEFHERGGPPPKDGGAP